MDSELACLALPPELRKLTGLVRNSTYTTTNNAWLHPTNGLLMVARLDGPTAEIARGLVDLAVAAETNGLWGRAYFDSRSISVGDRFETGSVLLEVTSTRIPCNTLTARMGDPAFARHFMQAGRPGFYCRVLRDGVIQTGDAVTYTPFPGEPVTMPELLRTYGRNLSDEDRIRYLAAPINDKLRAALTG